MSAEHFRIQATEGSVGFKNGSSVNVRIYERPRPSPGETAEHEAAHVVAAPGIQEATIIRRGNALGTTIPTVMTVAAAGAAAALGHGGVSHDLRVAAAFGASEGSAKAAGHAALAGKHDLVHEVAVTLQEEKTITQFHVDQAKKSVEERRLGIHAVEIQITSPHGEVEIRLEKTFRGEVIIASPWLQSRNHIEHTQPEDVEKRDAAEEADTILANARRQKQADEDRLTEVRKELAIYEVVVHGEKQHTEQGDIEKQYAVEAADRIINSPRKLVTV